MKPCEPGNIWRAACALCNPIMELPDSPTEWRGEEPSDEPTDG